MSNLGRIRAGAAEVEVILKDKKFLDSLNYIELRMKALRNSLPRWNFSLGLSGLSRINGMIGTLGQQVKVLGDRIKVVANSFTALGGAMVASGIAGLVATGLPVRDYMRFSDAIQTLKATSGASADEITRLRDQARLLGRTTSFTPQEAAEGQVELSRGGFAPDEIMESTDAVLSLARATNTDLVTAANTAIRVIRGFNLAAKDAGHVADVATATVNSSAQVITDYAEAMTYVGASAAEVNVSFEEVSAALAILADNGVKGSLAGTGLRRMFLNMADPGLRKQFDEMMTSFGAVAPSFIDSENNMRPFVEILKELDAATKGLGNADKLAAFSQLFGRGVTAALKTSGSSDLLGQFSKYLEEAELVSKKAAMVMENQIGGAWRFMTSAFDDVIIAIGSKLEPVMTGLFQTGQTILNSANEFIEKNQLLVVSVLAVSATLISAGAAMFAFGTAIRLAGFAISGIGSLISITSGLITAFTSPIGLLGIAFVALGAAVFKFTDGGKAAIAGFMSYVGPAFERLKSTFSAIHDAVANGNMANAWAIVRAAITVEVLHIQQFVEKHFGDMIRFVMHAFSGDGIAEGLQYLNDIFSTFFSDIAGDIAAMGGAIASATSAVWGWIVVGAEAAYSALTILGQDATNRTLAAFHTLSGGLIGIFVGWIPTFVFVASTLYTVFSTVAGLVYTALSALGSVVMSIFGVMTTVAVAAWDFAGDAIVSVIMTVANTIGSIVAYIASFFAPLAEYIYDSLVDPFVQSYQVVAEVVGAIVAFVYEQFVAMVGRWASIGEAMAAVFSDFGSFISGYWAEVVKYFSEAFGAVASNWDRAVGGMFSSWKGFMAGLQKLWVLAGTAILQGVLYLARHLAGVLDALGAIMGYKTNMEGFVKDMQAAVDHGMEDRFQEIERTQLKKARDDAAAAAANDATGSSDLQAAKFNLEQLKKQAEEERKRKIAEMAANEADITRFDKQKFGDGNLAVDDEDPLKKPLESTLKSVGAFNAAAAQRLGGGGIEKQHLAESKKLNKGMDRVAANTEALKGLVTV